MRFPTLVGHLEILDIASSPPEMLNLLDTLPFQERFGQIADPPQIPIFVHQSLDDECHIPVFPIGACHNRTDGTPRYLMTLVIPEDNFDTVRRS
jgi:hypothetical protein